jgi:hypothetical protein
MTPFVYADFHNLDDDNRLVLDSAGTKADLQRLGLVWQDGLAVTFYMDDADENGSSDPILVDAVVRFDTGNQRWVADANWSSVRHASDEQTSGHVPLTNANGTPGKPNISNKGKS